MLFDGFVEMGWFVFVQGMHRLALMCLLLILQLLQAKFGMGNKVENILVKGEEMQLFIANCIRLRAF